MPGGVSASSMEGSPRREDEGQVQETPSLLRSLPPDGTGHLKGAPMTLIPEAPDPRSAALIATPVARDSVDVLAWDMAWDIVDQWGAESFPASDPPANW